MSNGYPEEPGKAGVHSKKKRTESKQWGKRELRWDDIIIVIFALLGFIGSVVLYRTASAPPPIIAFFLAMGVASLVYRFLGGLEKAELVWGTLKITGTMAALIGIAVYVNSEIKAQQSADDLRFQERAKIMKELLLEPVDGLYDWQYAGAGWSGYIEVKKDGSAETHMQRYLTCNGVQKPVTLLRQVGPGKVEADEFQTEVHVNIPVQFVKYDANCNETGVDGKTVLTGHLLRKPAFAGPIEYQNQYGAPLGGMVIVKGITP
jgi:hypothetical protein